MPSPPSSISESQRQQTSQHQHQQHPPHQTSAQSRDDAVFLSADDAVELGVLPIHDPLAMTQQPSRLPSALLPRTSLDAGSSTIPNPSTNTPFTTGSTEAGRAVIGETSTASPGHAHSEDSTGRVSHDNMEVEKPSNASDAAAGLSGSEENVLSSTDITTMAKHLPVLNLTLMLTSGARHPYRLDEKYLAKRNVNIPATTDEGKKDPASISVYTLKELILREWRDEWEAQPSSPGSIRLIYYGRLLEDKATLKGMHLHSLSDFFSAC